ncbi:MAG TPA: FecR domain-containing protein [Planctomycetota bacterium]|nr:FecR domain-containing protein [Planctomycetota bacterium]
MNRSEQHPELLELAAAVCNGTITPEQHERLQQLLAADPEARQLYFDYLDLHLALGQTHQTAQEAQPMMQFQKALAAPVRRGTRGLLAAAAGILFCALIYYFVTRPTPSIPIATLVQSASARFYGAGESLRVGSALATLQEYALKAGRVEVRFRNGVTAIVEGPAVFEVRDEMRLHVTYGKCSVNVVPGAEGFAVETPLTRIVDRGTRFAVDVDEAGETEVQVVQGKAEVQAPSAAPTMLTEGAGRRYTAADRATGKDVPYDQRRFPMDMPDRVVRYSTTPRPGSSGAEHLTGVTVRRGGRERTYAVGELIGVQLIHFKNLLKNGKFIATVTDGPDPALSGGSRTALLEEDTNINTGVINPGGSQIPLTSDPVMNDPEDPKKLNTPGMGIRFKRPVVNDAGPDIVLFDFQPVIQPEYGDPFHVSPLHFDPGLHSHSVTRFDLGTFSPEAQVIAGFRLNTFEKPVSCLSQLRTTPFRGTNFTVTSKLLAVGIDLSDLGYPPGAAVDGMFIQDALDDGNQVDPVFIAGLPPLENK